MADEILESEETENLKARRNRMTGNSRQRAPIGTVIIFLLFIGIAAVIVVFPEETRRLLGFETSSSEDIQQVSQIDNSGISTQIQRQPEFTVEQPDPVINTPTIQLPDTVELNDEAKARLEALEKTLKDLANRPTPQGGPTASDIQKLLDQQATALRAEAESRERLLQAQLEALQAQTKVPTGPSADELAEAERLHLLEEEKARQRALLEKRRAEREAELKARMVSDGNVYDESEEGTSSSGSKDDETGVRELSDNEQFLQASASQGWDTARANELDDISNTIVQGTLISAVLETAIDSELPGNIRAQVTRPVYSYDGKNILMPAGTRLIGSYNPKISIAQKRVLIAWNRAITPEGKSVKLKATGVDGLGRGGQRGNVDSRFFQRFGTAVVITSIAAIPSFLANDDATGNNSTTQATTGVAQDVSDDLKDTTEDVLEEYLKLPPIIRVPQGTLMNALVNQDLVFS